jgi:hypothetical protein
MKKQGRLNDSMNELYFLASGKISRREAVSRTLKIAIGASAALFSGGLASYAIDSYVKEATANFQVKISKSYNPRAENYEIGLKVIAPELDDLKAYYENASIQGVLDKSSWSREREGIFLHSYSSAFFTRREIGEQKMRVEVEKDGVKSVKDFFVNVALNEDEISSNPLKREDLKLLWSDLLEDTRLRFDREDLLRKECEIVNAAEIKKVSRPSSIYLKELTSYLLSSNLDYRDVLRGISLLVPTLNTRPWICYGNFTEDINKAEFLLDENEAYWLTKFLSEVDVDEAHFYAARAITDQMVFFSDRLKIRPLDVVEYKGKKLQLFDLIKELAKKHFAFESQGKRESVKDFDLVGRWSDRSKVNNNRHIYYNLRQVQFPVSENMLFGFVEVDPINRRYVWEDDKNFHYEVEGKAFAYADKALNILSLWIENYGKFNEELKEILTDPNRKVGECSCSPLEGIHGYVDHPFWTEFFPNSIIEARKDNYDTLLFKGSKESRNSILLYGYSLITFNSPKWIEEVRVELATCYGSIAGYPLYRGGFNYPEKKRLAFAHGEPSFIINKNDENLLYERSTNELLLDRENTYTLNFIATRKDAAKKDGIIELYIYVPGEVREIKW